MGYLIPLSASALYHLCNVLSMINFDVWLWQNEQNRSSSESVCLLLEKDSMYRNVSTLRRVFPSFSAYVYIYLFNGRQITTTTCNKL